MNTKLCELSDEEVPLVLEYAPLALDGFSMVHGTATCFSAEELELAVVPADAPALETEMTAKSTLPEEGLMITSLMVPRFSPDEEVTLALFNWLADSSW
ncbi:MAG TPA: hypothetical protein VHH88_03615 [Verrucomicrobiae bacterium]|nr:hypothetical protein [Verrucomicrobiae bacterium]